MTTVSKDQLRFRLDLWKDSFTMRSVNQWSMSPREAVRSPVLEVSKCGLHKILSDPLMSVSTVLLAEPKSGSVASRAWEKLETSQA